MNYDIPRYSYSEYLDIWICQGGSLELITECTKHFLKIYPPCHNVKRKEITDMPWNVYK